MTHYCKSFWQDGTDYRKYLSKKETYFDFKVYALVTLESFINIFEVTPTSIDNREGFRDLIVSPFNLIILADKVRDI